MGYKTNPTTAKILHTNPNVHHRSGVVNNSTSSGHNFFKSGPVEKNDNSYV